MAKHKNDKSKQVHLFNMLGKTCLEFEEMEKVLDYFENGLDLAQRTKCHPLETELTIKLSELPLSLEIWQNPFLSRKWFALGTEKQGIAGRRRAINTT
jgi:hypothetical protein